ncbi:hypothetical protein [Halobellus limi]|uniref:Uncharacterized protein n=1 Tax=Halobellus limi TaxID=699433 RepID=A0A1H5VLP5_9EURY|nr:hypothetical protein [Halobellus limi]QCC48838.1 hypothetical protein DV707_02785 [Halobellus limi]SEF88130.1 hypothetical protein SAMN04488133_0999 [Halobellus limi]
MSRRVPEFAVVTGVFLGLSVVVTGVTLGWGLYATAVIGALVSYPFVGFGIVRDDDPAATIRPRWLLAAGVVIALAGAFGVLLDDPSPGGLLRSALVGLVLGAPPASYAVRYGADVNPLPPRATVSTGGAVGLALVVFGLFVAQPLVGVAAGAIAALGSALYGTARGVDFGPRTKRRGAAAGGLLGVGVVAIGVLTGGPLGEWLLVGTAVALVPSLYAALTLERAGGIR